MQTQRLYFMNSILRWIRTLSLVLAAVLSLNASAQIAVVDLSNPTNPVVAYGGGPYIYAPNVPTQPTTVYTNVFTLIIPSTKDSTATIEYDAEADALLNAGVVEGTAANLDAQYADQAPVVITGTPDTYTTNSPPWIYYTAPTNDPPLVSTTNSGPFYFDFGTATSPVAPGYTKVSDKTAYAASSGYGWGDITKVSSRDRGVKSDPLASDFCLPNGTPFYLDLANGTYTVSVLSGDAIQKAGMQVRGNGLLELYNMGSPAGNYLQQSFPITITDGRLRLEFFGSICHVNAIQVQRVPDNLPHKTTIFVASDSTAAAYTQYQYPLTGWGDRISYYLTDDVVVDDQAKAGRSTRSFIEEGGVDTIVNRIQPNDYLFIMSAINDSASDKSGQPPRKTNPTTTYKAYLRVFVNAARAHGAIPVFVTSQTKNTYDIWGRYYNSVGDYPQAMRDFGAELNVPVIDLNQKSIDLFTSAGPNFVKTNYFINLPSGVWPNYPNGYADYIHFQDHGATALAGQVVDGIRELNLPGLAPFIITNAPPAPAGLTATPVSSSQINLSWTASPTARSYNVKRAGVSGGPYTTIASGVTGTDYSDNSLAPGASYFYVVSAVNVRGESADSAEASATTVPGPSAVPTGLTAVAGYSQVTLNWNPSLGATSYNVKRSTTSGGPYTTIASPADSAFTDASVVNYTTYYYVVSAVNSYAESGNSSEVRAMPVDLLGYWKFDETNGTVAADSIGAHNGALNGGATWTGGILGNAVHLDGVNGFVSLPSGLVNSLADFTISTWVNVDKLATWERIFDFGSGTGVYMFLTPDSGNSTVRYAITTSSGGGEQQINSASVLSTGVWHHVAVTLAGNVGILYIDGQEAGRNSAMTLKPSSLGSTSQNYLGKSQWSDPYLPGSVDDFRIYAHALSSAEIVSLASGNLSAAPASPTGLTASGGYEQATLNWTAPAGAGSYNVKRATVSGGPYSTVATGVAETAYTDTGLSDGTPYYYVVSAVNDDGESPDSAQAVTMTAPASPAGLTAGAVSSSQINLSWMVSSTATSYNVKRAATSGGPYTIVAAGVTATDYADTGLNSGTAYYYVVSSINDSGESANSAQVGAMTLPAAPTGLTASVASSTQLDLSWTGSFGAASYNVKRAATSGGPYTTVAAGVTATSFADTGLNDKTTYYYVVSAVDSGGESANSTEASATTIPANTTYSGRATVLKAGILGVTNAWSDTGLLPASGGAVETSLLAINEPDLLSAEIAHASVVGQADRTRAESSVANFAVDIGGVTLAADFAMSRAMAVWQTNGIALSGSSEIASLFLNGQPVVVSGQPNQTVPFINGAVIINEQTGSSNAITVNALHLVINGVADVVVASAQAGIASVTQPSCSGGDYITGGGWITGTPGGAKGNFGVSGGITNGVYWGDLTYEDHGNGMTVKSTSVTSYQSGATSTTRHIEGTAQINGVAGFTYAVDVTDNGEPGSQDVFTIRLSNGYQASGNLGGGNIQLHQPCQ